VHLLLVEDDAMIGDALVALLRQERYVVDWVRDGVTGDAALEQGRFDVVILDLGLPRRDGVSVLRAMRARRDHTPVLVATARDAVRERVLGLDAGADDYLIKPFDFDELLARLRSLLRRVHGEEEALYRHGDVSINAVAREAKRQGELVELSGREWAILTLLLLRPGATLSRQQLEDRLYGWAQELNSNAVEVHIHGLRRKLGTDLILNVRGLGYRVPAASDDES
jgi:two-component system OmpR family response regulator